MTSRRARPLLVASVALVVSAGTAVAPAAAPARVAAASAGPDLTALQWGPPRVGAVAARSGLMARLGTVTVAVLDSGVAVHPDLPTLDASDASRANFTTDPGSATDDASGHGTHVAGVIAGAVGGGGVDGVAPGVRILPVKVVNGTGTGRASWVARGVDYAVAHGADVINLSMVSTESSTELDAALAAARSRGVVLVAAAGNGGATGDPRLFPAASVGVIAVGATDRADRVAAFSETGPQLDLVAPGVDIASTAPGGRYRSMDGTSEAAPHVAAAAALVRAAVPGASPDLVERALESSATDLGAPGRDDTSGYGLLDAARAVAVARVLAAVAH